MKIDDLQAKVDAHAAEATKLNNIAGTLGILAAPTVAAIITDEVVEILESDDMEVVK